MATLVNMRAKKSRKDKEIKKGLEPKRRTIVRSSPEEKTFMMMSAVMAYEMGDYEGAVEIYEAVEVMIPDWSQPVTGVGMAYLRLDRSEDAEDAFRRALEIDPKDVEANLYLGELVWQQRQDEEESLALLSTARTLDSKSAHGARAAYVMNQIAEAIRKK